MVRVSCSLFSRTISIKQFVGDLYLVFLNPGVCLKAFNAKRRLHQQTPDLVWDGVSEAQAQAVADAIPAGSKVHYGKSNFYGHIGFVFYTNGKNSSTEIMCQRAVDKW